jgi:hypothetical protein
MVRRSRVPKGKLVTITALGEEINWTIPLFPVLTLKFVVVELEGGHLAVIKSSDRSKLKSFPTIIDCWSTECQITIGINTYTVLWDWELHKESETQRDGATRRDEEPENDFLDSLLGLNEHAHRPEESFSSGSPESDFSDDEESLVCSHELPFKVMGVVHNSDRQKHLENAFETIYGEQKEVLVRIRPDPTNKFDADAIPVELDYGSDWKLVGFLLKDLTQYVHHVLNSRRLLSVQIGHIRFQTQWQMPGFYAKILVKCKGMWQKEVISASRRVK